MMPVSGRNTVVVVLLVAAAATVLFMGGERSSSETETPELSVVWPDYGPNPTWYPIEEGIVTADNVSIDPKKVSPGEEGRITLSGNVDMGTMDLAGIADLYRSGRFDEFVVIGGYYSEGVYNGQSAMQVFARKDSGITAPEDLRGKTVALGEPGSTSNLLFKAVMDQRYNVSPDAYTLLHKPDMAPVLLEQGEVDAAMAWSNHVVDEEWRSDYVSVVDFGEDYKRMYGDVPSNAVIVAPEQEVRANPAAYAEALETIRRANEWSNDHGDRIIDAFAARSAEFNKSVWKEVWHYSSYYHPLDADRMSANNQLFEIQSRYGDAEGNVTMEDLYLSPERLAQGQDAG